VEIARATAPGAFCLPQAVAFMARPENSWTRCPGGAGLVVRNEPSSIPSRHTGGADQWFHPTVLRLAPCLATPTAALDLVVNLWCGKAHKEGLIQVCNGEQWRPFIHVRDAAAAFAKTLKRPFKW